MKMATGSNIRTLRNLAGLTLEQLSELSGVEVGTISALENRDSSRSKYFPAIAQAFGITTDDLLFVENFNNKHLHPLTTWFLRL